MIHTGTIDYGMADCTDVMRWYVIDCVGVDGWDVYMK